MAARKKRRKGRSRKAKRGIHVSPKAGRCRYRSGWELALMVHLDADETVASYQYEPLSIAYVSNARTGKVRRYIPDMLVVRADGTRELIEVKPKRRLSNSRVKKKLAAAEIWCKENGVQMRVITEVELKEIGCVI